MRKKQTEIHIRLSAEDKDRLTYLAGVNQKTMSQFLLDPILKPPPINIAEPEKVPDYSSELAEIQKQLFIIARLVLYSASAEQRHNEEDVIEFFERTAEKAAKIFGKKE